VTYKIFPEENGIIWIATNEGLIRYDENLQKNYTQSFKTILRKIIAGQNSLNTSPDSLTQKTVSLSFNNNTIRFEYAGLWFEKENKTQYQTWLEGFEKDWSNWDYNSYKEYTNLSFGKYTFHVRALNIYQKQSEEAVYTFEILPPWYRTWWAYLLYILAFVSLVYFVVRYRTRQLHVRQRELEMKVNERTLEVKQQAEELSTVNQISQALAVQINLDDLIKLVGDQMRDLFKANIVYLALLDKNTNTISFPYQHGEVLPQ